MFLLFFPSSQGGIWIRSPEGIVVSLNLHLWIGPPKENGTLYLLTNQRLAPQTSEII